MPLLAARIQQRGTPLRLHALGQLLPRLWLGLGLGLWLWPRLWLKPLRAFSQFYMWHK